MQMDRKCRTWTSICANIGVGFVVALGGLGSFPDAGKADPSRIDLTVDASSIADFQRLVEVAEATARQRISQAFAADPTLDRLYVQVLAERNGAVVPLLTTEVAREDWQSNASLADRTQYFSNGDILLSYVVLEPPEPESGPSDATSTASRQRSRSQPTQASSPRQSDTAETPSILQRSQQEIEFFDSLD